MDKAKTKDSVIFSSFPINLNTKHTTILVDNKEVVIAHPQLLNKKYTENLPKLDFDVKKILFHYLELCMLKIIQDTMPVEFDTKEEFEKNILKYKEITLRW